MLSAKNGIINPKIFKYRLRISKGIIDHKKIKK
jgi:hypothetical protein